MAASKYIQAYGKDRVLELYENAGIRVWAIRCGKEFQFKGDDATALDKMLEMLEEGQESATYTLSLYETPTGADQVNSSTGYDTAFNFKLCESPLEKKRNRGETMGDSYAVRRIAQLEEGQTKILQLLQETETVTDEKPKKQKLGALGELLSHPAIAPVLPMIISQVVGMLFKNGATAPAQLTPAYMPSVGSLGSVGSLPMDERIQKAIAILADGNPKLPDQLEKLALIKQSNVATFNMIVNALDQQ